VPWWEEGRALRLLLWGIPQARYINAHFLDVVKTVEGYWGVVTPEGRKKPGFAVLQEIAQENSSASP